MTVRLYSALLLGIFAFSARAQLVVDNTQPAGWLVQNVLLGGGVTANSVTFNGNPGNQQNEQIGSFDGSAANVGLSAGVLMGTGDINEAVGPNSSGSMTLGGGNYGFGDPDLEMLSGVTSNDAAILEFNFIPTGDSLKFRYVFSSEEYNEYVCSTVNDAFGFFLSGPGITGPYSNNAINIALVPGTTIPVSINTVNNGTVGSNGTASNCSDLDPNWTANSIYFNDNTNGTTIEYDGFTVVLTAFALVQCGVQYHIKLCIADGGDAAFDSGVFLEAGSFTSTGQVVPSLAGGVGIIGNTMMEGCAPVDLVFVRLGDTTLVDTVDLTVTGTATQGVDYTAIFPSQLIFPIGEDSLHFPMSVPLDADGLETITFTIEQLIDCAGIIVQTVFNFNIDSPPPLSVQSNNINGICGQTHLLAPVVSGGIGNYTYLWSTGETTSTITVGPAVTTTYSCTVSDACSVVPVTVDFTVTLPIYPPLVITVDPPTAIDCLGTGPIGVTSATGGDGVYTYAWTVSGAPVNPGNTATITVPASDPLYYVVTVGEGCGTSVQDSVLVTTVPLPPIVITTGGDTTVICVGDTTVIEVINIVGGNGVYTLA
ncbi:MAG TPA: choice-of-anchor L domain-containing protein, partial [Flavobacteriales bacterium]|nr:choice-of-anchor L domain-containing protein [Flavobacteriales bacterium]